MKLEINVRKKYFFGILAVLIVVAFGIGVYAFGTNNPAVFGHSTGEIDWTGTIPQICLSDGCVATRASLVGPVGPQGPAGNINNLGIAGLPLSRVGCGLNYGTNCDSNGNGWVDYVDSANSAGSANYATTAGSVAVHGCTLGTSEWLMVSTTGNNGYAECGAGQIVTGFDRNILNTPSGFWIKCTQISC